MIVNPYSPKRQPKSMNRNLRYQMNIKNNKTNIDVRSKRMNSYKTIFPSYGVNCDGSIDDFQPKGDAYNSIEKFL